MAGRVLALVLALMLCAAALASGRYVIDAGGVAALVDGDGGAIIPAGACETLFTVREGALYAAGSAGDYDLYDAEGKLLAGPFEMLSDQGGAVVFRRGGQYGVLGDGGDIVVAPAWTQLAADGLSGCLALQTNPLDEQPDAVFALSPDGAATATGVLVDGGLGVFHEGRMVYRASDGRYGCLDVQGRAVIPAEWAWLGDFADGVAIVSDGAAYGLIDRDGALRVPPHYIWLQRGEGLLLALTEDGAMALLSPDGAEVYCEIPDVPEAQLAGTLAAARRPGGVTLYDAAGAVVYEASPSALCLPGLDGQVIVSDGAWGEACATLVHPDGTAASQPWPRILPLTSGRYAVMTFGEAFSNVRVGLMDGQGAMLLPVEYRDILPAGQDRLVLVTDDEVIFADLDGRRIAAWRR